MKLIELKQLIAKKLGIALISIGAEDFKAYGVRFHYLGATYRATTDLAVEKVDAGCLVADEGARHIEKLIRNEEWDGEGLPPVGCECEGKQPAQLNWNKFRVVAIENGHVFGFWNDNVSTGLDSRQWEFRPIRSEADKNRDASIQEMIELIDSLVGERANPVHGKKAVAEKFYDAIAAGKISHIRID